MLIFLLGFICAFSLVFSIRLKDRILTITIKDLFSIFSLSICIISLISVVLFEHYALTLKSINIMLLFFSILFFSYYIVFKTNRMVFLKPRNLKQFSAIIFILIIGLFLRYPPSNYVAGGQDPGVYPNIGNAIARTGEPFLFNPIRYLVGDVSDIENYYTYHSLTKTGIKVDGKMGYELVPGVYLNNLSDATLITQFYPIVPIWFSIFSSVFGSNYTTYALVLFSFGNMLLIFLLSKEIFKNYNIGLLSVLFYAVNPALSYYSKLPVSETISSFFFLSAIYFLLLSNGRNYFTLTLSALCFFGLFFTRITGFVFVPIIVFYLMYRMFSVRSFKQRLRLFSYGIVVIAFYTWSVLHGLAYSYQYSRDIYAVNLGVTGNYLNVLLIFSLMCFVAMLIPLLASSHIRPVFGLIWKFILSNRTLIVVFFLSAIIFWISYRAYLLAYSDTYIGHHAFDLRWKIAGNGLYSITKHNAYVLMMFLSPVGMLSFIIGLYLVLVKAIYKKQYLILSLFILPFIFTMLIFRDKSPYQYYWGRYLASELLPLAIIIVSYFIITTIQKIPNQRGAQVIGILIVFSIVVPNAVNALRHNSEVELEGFYESLKKIDKITADNSLLIVDKLSFPSAIILTPMILTFDKPVIMFSRPDKNARERLQMLASYIARKGYRPVLLTIHKGWEDVPYVEIIDKVVVPQKVLLQSIKSFFPAWKYSQDVKRHYVSIYKFIEHEG
jgi:hypothetical protein